MEGDVERLGERFEQLLRQTAEAGAQLQAVERPVGESVRYLDIELAAHAIGRRVSQQVQERSAREVAAEHPETAACPTCGSQCSLKLVRRQVHSIDGPVELGEYQGNCRRCRRSFLYAEHVS
jgi:hypothetical protein